MANKKLVTNNCAIDGYIRDIEKSLYPQIIPSSINHLIHSYYDPWFKLKHIPQSLTFISPAPSLYHNKDNNTYHFIVCPHYQNTRNIYMYNCNDDEWEILTEYPPNVDAGCHGAIIDENKQELYIFLGHNGIFGKFNLHTKKWSECNTLFAKSANPACIWLPDPINEIHAILSDQVHDMEFEIDGEEEMGYVHAKYSDKYRKFVKASNYSLDNHGNFVKSFMIKMNVKNKDLLISIGGDIGYGFGGDDRIWFCELMDYEWKLFPNKLPCKTYANAVCFGQILIAQTMDNDENYTLYFLEVENCNDNNGHHWMKFEMEVPKTLGLAMDRDNYLYFLDFDDNNKASSKIHLSSILPPTLYLKYL